jgi:hypothetical protein
MGESCKKAVDSAIKNIEDYRAAYQAWTVQNNRYLAWKGEHDSWYNETGKYGSQISNYRNNISGQTSPWKNCAVHLPTDGDFCHNDYGNDWYQIGLGASCAMPSVAWSPWSVIPVSNVGVCVRSSSYVNNLTSIFKASLEPHYAPGDTSHQFYYATGSAPPVAPVYTPSPAITCCDIDFSNIHANTVNINDIRQSCSAAPTPTPTIPTKPIMPSSDPSTSDPSTSNPTATGGGNQDTSVMGKIKSTLSNISSKSKATLSNISSKSKAEWSSLTPTKKNIAYVFLISFIIVVFIAVLGHSTKSSGLSNVLSSVPSNTPIIDIMRDDPQK